MKKLLRLNHLYCSLNNVHMFFSRSIKHPFHILSKSYSGWWKILCNLIWQDGKTLHTYLLTAKKVAVTLMPSQIIKKLHKYLKKTNDFHCKRRRKLKMHFFDSMFTYTSLKWIDLKSEQEFDLWYNLWIVWDNIFDSFLLNLTLLCVIFCCT